MEERQGEREIKVEFLLWLHDMEKPVPKPVPKAGPLVCMETKDLTRGLDRNMEAWPCLVIGNSVILYCWINRRIASNYFLFALCKYYKKLLEVRRTIRKII